MSDTLQYSPVMRKQRIELSYEERAQLNALFDLLIPADENFPPPSSLHLIDEILHRLIPSRMYCARLAINEKQLRALLQDLDVSVGGNFCKASIEKQQMVLRKFERSDPVLFQELWTLINHSYYTRLALRHSSLCIPQPVKPSLS